MAAGLPVICLDLGGVALQVSEETGTKVPAVSPEQLVRDLMLAMGRLAGDQELRRRLGETAQKRVQSEFTWDAKAQHISECYRQAVVTV